VNPSFSATFATRQAARPLSEQLPLIDLSPNDRRFVCCLGFARNAQLDSDLWQKRCAGVLISAKNWSNSAATLLGQPPPTNGSSVIEPGIATPKVSQAEKGN
jgi:hypothetical protein